jgi:RHS repeat-associated protein
MTDASRNKVFQRDYYPFGTELMVSGYGTDYRYTGKELDSETGLYYYGARYYDPKIGRFISVDPVKDYTNPYSYVRNNPLNATDPSGMRTSLRMKLTRGGDFFGRPKDRSELAWEEFDEWQYRAENGLDDPLDDWDYGSGQQGWRDVLDWREHLDAWRDAQAERFNNGEISLAEFYIQAYGMDATEARAQATADARAIAAAIKAYVEYSRTSGGDGELYAGGNAFGPPSTTEGADNWWRAAITTGSPGKFEKYFDDLVRRGAQFPGNWIDYYREELWRNYQDEVNRENNPVIPFPPLYPIRCEG